MPNFEAFISQFNKTNRKALKMWKVLKLSKLLRIGRIVRYLRRYFKYRHIVVAALLFLLLSHLYTCLWFLVESGSQPMRWDAVAAGDGTLSLTQAYLSTLDGTVAILLNLGRARAPSPGLQLLSIGGTIFGVALVSYVVGEVALIVRFKVNERSTFRAKLDRVMAEMRTLQLPLSLQHRVKVYYDYLWLNRKREGTAFICNDSDLSSTLRADIALHLAKNHFPLHRVAMFRGCSDECLAALVQRMRTHAFMPGDYVCRQGEVGRELFYISKGTVEIVVDSGTPRSNTTSAAADRRPRLQEGSFFGEVALLTDHSRRTASIVAVTVCELSVLTKDDLFSVFEDHPAYAEMLRSLALQRLQQDRRQLQAQQQQQQQQREVSMSPRLSPRVRLQLLQPPGAIAEEEERGQGQSAKAVAIAGVGSEEEAEAAAAAAAATAALSGRREQVESTITELLSRDPATPSSTAATGGGKGGFFGGVPSATGSPLGSARGAPRRYRCGGSGSGSGSGSGIGSGSGSDAAVVPLPPAAVTTPLTSLPLGSGSGSDCVDGGVTSAAAVAGSGDGGGCGGGGGGGGGGSGGGGRRIVGVDLVSSPGALKCSPRKLCAPDSSSAHGHSRSQVVPFPPPSAAGAGAGVAEASSQQQQQQQPMGVESMEHLPPLISLPPLYAPADHVAAAAADAATSHGHQRRRHHGGRSGRRVLSRPSVTLDLSILSATAHRADSSQTVSNAAASGGVKSGTIPGSGGAPAAASGSQQQQQQQRGTLLRQWSELDALIFDCATTNGTPVHSALSPYAHAMSGGGGGAGSSSAAADMCVVAASNPNARAAATVAAAWTPQQASALLAKVESFDSRLASIEGSLQLLTTAVQSLAAASASASASASSSASVASASPGAGSIAVGGGGSAKPQ